MNQTTRIILNTGANYGRSVFAIVMSLFSTRWILDGLGQTDFGLFSVVGSLIVMMTMMNGGLSVGVVRFYAFAIGEGERDSEREGIERLKHWFNTAFSIHLLSPIIPLLVGWPLGEYAILHWFTIPDERMQACLLIFRVSLITVFVTIISVPFVAMYRATQRIVELAFFGMLRTTAIFVLAFSLSYTSSDRLVVYGLAMAAISVTILLIQIFRASLCFPACRVKWSYMFEMEYLKKLFGFSGWKLFGMGCVSARLQGTPMLVNLHFGPVVNAAYGVANGLSMQATALSDALTSAFAPAVTTAEGTGSRERTIFMAMQSCKFGSLLIILFAVPLILEMDNLLLIWLKNPPEYATTIGQWLLAMLILDRMTTGQMLAVNARGKIGLYEIIQGASLVSALPLMWLLFQVEDSPVFIGVALFISMLIYCVGRMIFAKYLLDFPVIGWIKAVGLPIFGAILIGGLVGLLITSYFPESFLRLCFTSAACVVVLSTYAWMLVFDVNDRAYTLKNVRKLLVKVPLIGERLADLLKPN